MSTAVLTAVAWAYKNGARHIGHKSGSGVASGVFARCHRMAGNRVLIGSGRLALDAAARKLADIPAEGRETEKSLAQEMASAAVSQGGTGRATIGPRTAGPSGPGGGEGRRRSDTLLQRVQDRPRTVFA